MSLWWLEKGWTDALCATCGAKIWPEGDPDWGYCFSCFNRQLKDKRNHERDEKLYYEEMERQYYETLKKNGN